MARNEHWPLLPPILRARVDPARTRQVAALVQSNGPPDPRGVQLFSNDYLALANHPDIAQATLAARAESRDSLWMSSVFFEEGSAQRQLERKFARYLAAEDAVLTQSGYCANLGLLQSIAGPGVHVYIDECAHASLWHGLVASRATPHRFRHNDPRHLDELLATSGAGIVIVDSVYSHNGAVGALPDMIAAAARQECVVVVDESHSLGTHGPHGAGMVVELGLERQVHFRTASLAKAFVTRAGLVVGSAAACSMLRYTAGPAIFSSACMAHDLAGLARAMDLIALADDRRRRVHASAADLRSRLADLGYVIASGSQIIALESGLEEYTLLLRRFLEDNGIYGSVFCAPATRKDESLVRLSIHADITEEQRDRIVDVCEKARNHVGFDQWASTRRRSVVAASRSDDAASLSNA